MPEATIGVSLRLPVDVREQLEACARDERSSLTQVALRAFAEYLRRRKEDGQAVAE